MQFESYSSKQRKKLRDYFGFLVLICGVLLGNRFTLLIAQSRSVIPQRRNQEIISNLPTDSSMVGIGVYASPLFRMNPRKVAGFVSEKEFQSRKLSTSASLSFTDITTTALGSTGLGSHGSVFADVTGNGLPDLYITTMYDNDMSDLFYRNTNGTNFTEDWC